MNKTVRKWYAKTFPDINVDETPSDELMLRIYQFIEPNLNLSNRDLVERLLSYGNVLYGAVKLNHIVKCIVNPSGKRGGSLRTRNYWINRGHSEEYAIRIISQLQSENSSRRKEYWLKRGCSDEEATSKVKEVQRTNAKLMHKRIKENDSTASIWCWKWWIQRGFSEEESKTKVCELQVANAQKYLKKYPTRESRIAHQKSCVEYWTTKGLPVEQYEAYMNRKRNHYSKSSIEFFDALCKRLTFSRPIYGENEFTKYIPNFGVVKYDFVDPTMKIVIEYDGLFWHTRPEVKKRDRIKEEFMTRLGFKVFRVAYEEHREDPTNAIEQLAKRIEDEIAKQN